MNEALDKVKHSLDFASDELRQALHKASPIEALVLMPILKQVVEARNHVWALCVARQEAHGNA